MQSYRSVFALMFSMMVAFSTSGCGEDAECAIDTDCPVFQRCNSDNQCVPIGVPDAEVDAGDASADGGVDAEAGMMDGDIPDAEVLGQGIVRVVNSGTSATASARFNAAQEEASCETEELGVCDLQRCTRELPVVPDAGVDAGMDAGMDADVPDAVAASHADNITVEGAGGSILLLEDSVTGLYSNASGPVPWTNEEPRVSFNASGGGGVDMFAIAVDAPPVVTVTQPTDLAALTSLRAGEQFALQWTEDRPDATGTLSLSLEPEVWEEGETEQVRVNCEFPLGVAMGVENSGTIQGAILGSLSTGRNHRLTLEVLSDEETMVGPWLVRGVANTVVISGSGNFTSGVVTLQPSMP